MKTLDLSSSMRLAKVGDTFITNQPTKSVQIVAKRTGTDVKTEFIDILKSSVPLHQQKASRVTLVHILSKDNYKPCKKPRKIV